MEITLCPVVFLSKTDNLILIVRDTHIMNIQLERDSAEHHLISTCQNCQDHQIQENCVTVTGKSSLNT